MAAETILSLDAWDEGRLAAGLDLMRDAVHRASRGFGTSSHSELSRSHLCLRLAKMLADVGRFNEANAVVRSAEEIEPSRRSVQAATSAVLRAQIELAAGRLDAAATAAGLATADQLGPTRWPRARCACSLPSPCDAVTLARPRSMSRVTVRCLLPTR